MIEKIYSTPCSKGGTHTIVIFTNGSAAWSCMESGKTFAHWPNLREE